MTDTNWRDNPVVQEIVLLARHAWAYGKQAPPVFDAIAGVVILAVFALFIPLLCHIFFEGSLTPAGVILDTISRAASMLFRLIGVVGACICWGWATRGFLEQRRQERVKTAQNVERS